MNTVGDIILYYDKVSNCLIPAILTKIMGPEIVSLVAFPEEGHPKNWISVKCGGGIGEWRTK